jgi:hypothetical protein
VARVKEFTWNGYGRSGARDDIRAVRVDWGADEDGGRCDRTMIWRGESLSRDRFTRSKQGSLTAVYGLWNSGVVRVNGCRR